jgi:uncharacterized membrane protein
MDEIGFSEIFSRANAEKQARRYPSLSFFEKPKNILGLFYCVALIYNALNLAFYDSNDIEILIRLISVIAYIIFIPLIFANKQTAMAIAAAVFVVMTVAVFLFIQMAFLRAPLVAFFCIALTVRASHVADALCKMSNKSVDVEIFD